MTSDSDAINRIRKLHKPKQRTTMAFGDSQCVTYRAHGKPTVSTPPSTDRELNARAREYFRHPECAHCQVQYPCPTIEALDGTPAIGAHHA